MDIERFWRAFAAAVATCGALTAFNAHALSVLPLDLDQLVAGVQDIAHVRCTANTVQQDPVVGVVTVTTFVIFDRAKGAPGASFVVRQPGGASNGLVVDYHVPKFVVYPSSGAMVALILNGYGTAPQVFNVKVNGIASLLMPSAWPAGGIVPPNNRPVLAGMSRAAGLPAPAFGGGSLIVQTTGALTLAASTANDLVFPGSIVLKSTGTLDVNRVRVDNGWTASGQSFQGVFFESPNIVSGGNIDVLTNNLNWINFSTAPHAPVRAAQLATGTGGTLQFMPADGTAPHLNTYSALVDVAASGGCWVCIVNSTPANLF